MMNNPENDNRQNPSGYKIQVILVAEIDIPVDDTQSNTSDLPIVDIESKDVPSIDSDTLKDIADRTKESQDWQRVTMTLNHMLGLLKDSCDNTTFYMTPLSGIAELKEV